MLTDCYAGETSYPIESGVAWARERWYNSNVTPTRVFKIKRKMRWALSENAL